MTGPDAVLVTVLTALQLLQHPGRTVPAPPSPALLPAVPPVAAGPHAADSPPAGPDIGWRPDVGPAAPPVTRLTPAFWSAVAGSGGRRPPQAVVAVPVLLVRFSDGRGGAYSMGDGRLIAGTGPARLRPDVLPAAAGR